jgi:hypothetical protein
MIIAPELDSDKKVSFSSSVIISVAVSGLLVGAIPAIVVGLPLRHHRRHQSESAKEIAFVDDQGHGVDAVPSDDYEGELFDIESEGSRDGAISTDSSA